MRPRRCESIFAWWAGTITTRVPGCVSLHADCHCPIYIDGWVWTEGSHASVGRQFGSNEFGRRERSLDTQISACFIPADAFEPVRVDLSALSPASVPSSSW